MVAKLKRTEQAFLLGYVDLEKLDESLLSAAFEHLAHAQLPELFAEDSDRTPIVIAHDLDDAEIVCPQCTRPTRPVVETPADKAAVLQYECQACSHRWRTLFMLRDDFASLAATINRLDFVSAMSEQVRSQKEVDRDLEALKAAQAMLRDVVHAAKDAERRGDQAAAGRLNSDVAALRAKVREGTRQAEAFQADEDFHKQFKSAVRSLRRHDAELNAVGPEAPH